MIPLALALSLLALPTRASQRYRWEIAGEPVGWASLSVRCAGDRCRVRFESASLRPEAAVGGATSRTLEAETDREGRLLGASWSEEGASGGRRRQARGGRSAALLAEVLLAAAGESERRCLEVEDEVSGETGTACATRRGEWLEGSLLGERLRARVAAGRLPEEVLLPSQGSRFAADSSASLPARPPRLFGVRVAAPPGAEGDQALRLCGLSPEPADPEPPPAGVPVQFPAAGSCREATARWLEAAAGRGLEGRHVVGVAFDGSGFVWHEWAEVRSGGRWVAVDPAFRQAPALGIRFAVARYAPGDAMARAEAGRRVLACWGRARIEPAP
ncbi:MAG TPA: transglutaminase domain-containing protein [Anaeromyxobacteraceae bacterium]|nr:transglutaminase domain-containing protein [Anaeromyxobacteraceae bacterium]